MQTRQENRDTELENLVGNLLIAEYQVEKLREKVSGNLGTHGFNKISQSVFKCNNNWYRGYYNLGDNTQVLFNVEKCNPNSSINLTPNSKLLQVLSLKLLKYSGGYASKISFMKNWTKILAHIIIKHVIAI